MTKRSPMGDDYPGQFGDFGFGGGDVNGLDVQDGFAHWQDNHPPHLDGGPGLPPQGEIGGDFGVLVD